MRAPLRSLLLAGFVLSACVNEQVPEAWSPDPDDQAWVEEIAPPPALPYELALTAAPAGAGARALRTLTGAPPSSRVRVMLGHGGLGPGPCPAAVGRCFDVARPTELLPVLGFVGPTGSATMSVQVPRRAAGDYVALQAAVAGAPGLLSPPLTRAVFPVGAAPSATADLDNDGFTPAQGDCEDADARVYPGAQDLGGDGVDADCDGVDGDDNDGDRYPAGSDCDDTNPAINPGVVERCDGVDDDCDTVPDNGACGLTATFTADRTPAQSDVLMVVDDSCSMSSFQANLSAAAAPFLSALQTRLVDFHIGVVTTDMDSPARSGRLVPAPLSGATVVTAQDDPVAALDDLESMVAVGVNGSVNEAGVAAIGAALGPLNAVANAGFRRPDVALDVVLLTDEEDYSTAVARADTLALLASTAGAVPVRVHFLTGGPNGCSYPPFGQVTDGDTTYRAALGPWLAVEERVCAADYTPFTVAVADRIAGSSTTTAFSLPPPVLPGSVTVTVDLAGVGTVQLTQGQFTVDPATGEVVVTGVALPPGTAVTITWDRG